MFVCMGGMLENQAGVYNPGPFLYKLLDHHLIQKTLTQQWPPALIFRIFSETSDPPASRLKSATFVREQGASAVLYE